VEEFMSTSEQHVIELNRVLEQKCLVERFVENTDWLPVKRFLSAAETDGKAILDIGCATGAIAQQSAESHGGWKSYLGLDLFSEYVDAFNRRGIARATAQVGTATRLGGVEDRSLDIVLFLFVLQHLSEEEGKAALAEIRRVAKPGALALVGLTVNPTTVEKRKPHAPRAAIEAGAEPVPTFIWNDARFLDALKQAGFEVQGSERIPGTVPYVKLYATARAI
jgi:ubiquinone/menaquinone biosynthesis C-methylase UbiE